MAAAKGVEDQITVDPVAGDGVVKAGRDVIVRINTRMMVMMPRTRHANRVLVCWKCTLTATVFCAVPQTTIRESGPTPLSRAR